MTRSAHHAQNFLHSPRLIQKLLDMTSITAEDEVYDIGGGKGIIATALAQRCRQVVSVEVDPALAALLRQKQHTYPNITVKEADFLSLILPDHPYKVFANIPFNMSADIIHKLTQSPSPPVASYLIVQKEFAKKLLSAPGGRTSQQAVLLGVRFDIGVLRPLLASDFYPRPRVTPVFLAIVTRPVPLVEAASMPLFRDFVVYCFNAFKPTLAEALRPLFSAGEFAAIATKLRCATTVIPTHLALSQWVALFEAALAKGEALTRLVGGYEQALARAHAGHTKLHRTR